MSDVRQRIAIVQMLDMNRPLKPQLDSIADELEAAAVWLAVSDPIDEQAIQTKALAEMNHHLAQPAPTWRSWRRTSQPTSPCRR
jgi:hypothetical protein